MKEKILEILLRNTEIVCVASGDNSETAVALTHSEVYGDDSARETHLSHLAGEIAKEIESI
ncbi:MAG: hypothetical protein ACI9AT_000417 [Ulvibacter sp.]|jgi:hypothetical protein